MRRLISTFLVSMAAMVLAACEPGSETEPAAERSDLRGQSEAQIWSRASAASFRNPSTPHTYFEADEAIPVSSFLSTALMDNEDWSDALTDFRTYSGLSEADARRFAFAWIRTSEITATCDRQRGGLGDRETAGFETCAQVYPSDLEELLLGLADHPLAADVLFDLYDLQIGYGLEAALVRTLSSNQAHKAILLEMVERDTWDDLRLQAVRSGLYTFEDVPFTPGSNQCSALNLAGLEMRWRVAEPASMERRRHRWAQVLAVRNCGADDQALGLAVRSLDTDPQWLSAMAESGEAAITHTDGIILLGRLAGRLLDAGGQQMARSVYEFMASQSEFLIPEHFSEDAKSRLRREIETDLEILDELITPTLSHAEAFDALFGLSGEDLWANSSQHDMLSRFAERHGYRSMVGHRFDPAEGPQVDQSLHAPNDGSGIALVDFYASAIEAYYQQRDAWYGQLHANRTVIQPQYSGPISQLAPDDASLSACPAEQQPTAQWPGITFDESFQVVRRSFNGTDWAVIGLSRWIDAPGEVSHGGYWVARSQDGEWGEPRYLGFQANYPWVVNQGSPLALICGDRLVIAADRIEIDQSSVTFPPVGMQLANRQTDIVLSVDWSEVEADRDGDGLTDLYESRLGLDPASTDTDDDGISDEVDPFPTLPAQSGDDTVLDAAVSSLILSTLFSSGGTPIMGMIGEGDAPVDIMDMIAAVRASPRLSTHSDGVHWITGDLERLGSAAALDRPVIVHDADTHSRLFERYGAHYPVSLSITERDGGGAWYVVWSASWIGGSFVVQERAGQLHMVPISNWIT